MDRDSTPPPKALSPCEAVLGSYLDGVGRWSGGWSVHGHGCLDSQHICDFPSLRQARARLTICGRDKQLNVVFRAQITTMVGTLNLYLDSELLFGWREASLIAAKAAGHGVKNAHNVQRWIHVSRMGFPTNGGM